MYKTHKKHLFINNILRINVLQTDLQIWKLNNDLKDCFSIYLNDTIDQGFNVFRQ